MVAAIIIVLVSGYSVCTYSAYLGIYRSDSVGQLITTDIVVRWLCNITDNPEY